MPLTTSSIVLASRVMTSLAEPWLFMIGSRIEFCQEVEIFGYCRKRWSGDSWAVFGSTAPVVRVVSSSRVMSAYFPTDSSHGLSDSRGVGVVPDWTEYLVVASTLVITRITCQAESLFCAQRPMIQKSS